MCITCCGRLDQLRETLPESIRANWMDSALQFVLLDYNSQDGLYKWVVSDEIWRFVRAGKLVYARYDNGVGYNSPHSKNMAHRIATGDILVDLNADTFCPPALVHEIRQTVDRGVYMRCMMPSTLGLIAMHHQDFFWLGGYDERLCEGYGFDDDSLSHRAEAMGLKAVRVPDHLCGCIHHGDDRRSENMREKDVRASAIRNAALTSEDIAANRLVANVDRSMGAGVVMVNSAYKVKLK